jgi:hypothetical protein
MSIISKALEANQAYARQYDRKPGARPAPRIAACGKFNRLSGIYAAEERRLPLGCRPAASCVFLWYPSMHDMHPRPE